MGPPLAHGGGTGGRGAATKRQPPWEETHRVTIQDQHTHWLEHGCQGRGSLAGRAGPGPWRWDQLLGWRSRFSGDRLQCPVEGGRGSARAASLAWIPGIWAALKDGEQLLAVGWDPCLLRGPSRRKDIGGVPSWVLPLPHTPAKVCSQAGCSAHA